MKIIPFNDTWNGALSNRSSKTDYIVLHHASAAKYSFKQCHTGHKSQGWSGIGYHFYVTKDGTIYEGRPLNKLGAHVSGYNNNSIGICAEGAYHIEKSMPEKQLKAIAELLDFLKGEYPSAKIVGHKELKATECPGKYYPLDKLKDYKSVLNCDDIVTDKKVYNSLDDVPSYYRSSIKKVIDKGALKGDEAGKLNLTEDICRVLTILDRLGKI